MDPPFSVRDTHASQPTVAGDEWVAEWGVRHGPHPGHRQTRAGDLWLQEPWLKDSWPHPDPDAGVGAAAPSADCDDDGGVEETHPAAPYVQGPPLALGGGAYAGGDGDPSARSRMPRPRKDKKQAELELGETVAMNQRMMPVVCDPASPRVVADAASRQQREQALITAGPDLLKEERDVRTAFEMFQTMRERIGYLYAFDIPQVLDAAALSADEGQARQLRDAFSLEPRDLITFEQFRHMADLIRDGKVPRTHSPGADEGGDVPIMPGQRGYKADKVDGAGKKKKGAAASPPPPRGAVPHHKWMDSKMGTSRCGVEIPDPVKRQFYNLHPDQPALLLHRDSPAGKRWTHHDPVVALDPKPVPPAKQEPEPEMGWSPFTPC